MKTPFIILLFNAGLALLIAILMSYASGFIMQDLALSFGLACFGVALVDLFIAIVLFLVGPKEREKAQGFLMSCGVLFLLSLVVCGGALNFH
jgi:hypothetical protein